MLLPAKVANAQVRPVDFTSWHLFGSNTARYDNFHTHGNAATSPYRFTGSQQYDEFLLNFNRAVSPYNRISGSFSGAINDSDYRSRFNGFVPERINLRQENGGYVVPYRAEAGDFLAFQSYRTIQRSLKGMQVEFQPDLNDTTSLSIALFSGMASRDWRDINATDGVSSGVSVLAANAILGTIGANFLYNYKKADGKRITASTNQYVFSAVYANKLTLGGQRLNLEGEIGHFVGDHQDLAGPGSGQNRSGNAYFAQLSGSPTALTSLGYRFRYEVYGQDYRPDTATIQPDRRSLEGHVSWRFKNGLNARGRVQSFRLNRQSRAPRDSDVYGLNISGQILPGTFKGFSGSVDAYRQTDQSLNQVSNTRTRVVNANFNKTLNTVFSLRAGYYYNNRQNRTRLSDPASLTRQYSAALNYRVNIGDIKGSISPGFVVRSTGKAGSANHEYNPTINASLNRGSHRLSLNYSFLDQNRTPGLQGLTTNTAGLKYSYDFDDYSVGMDANWYRRSPDNPITQNTSAWRLGVFLTLRFDTALPSRRPRIMIPQGSGVAPSEAQAMVLDLAALPPGLALGKARKHIKQAGLGKPTAQGSLLIWYGRVLRDLEQNQRLVLSGENHNVERSALIIDFDSVGNSDSVQQTYEQALQKLIQKYGNPVNFYEKGEFGPAIADDLATGQFARLVEWKAPGGTLRFGIPRRLDGQLRMELQFGRNFTDPRNALWSLEEAQ
ncbi:MAG: hypothetical protein COA84_12140 [Robiginitomaculum sp.]|nr:MAG: hypothetical protein COA84_12140 [Robiginitomaculum sp.]